MASKEAESTKRNSAPWPYPFDYRNSLGRICCTGWPWFPNMQQLFCSSKKKKAIIEGLRHLRLQQKKSLFCIENTFCVYLWSEMKTSCLCQKSSNMLVNCFIRDVSLDLWNYKWLNLAIREDSTTSPTTECFIAHISKSIFRSNWKCSESLKLTRIIMQWKTSQRHLFQRDSWLSWQIKECQLLLISSDKPLEF